jgi:hypothetical protein
MTTTESTRWGHQGGRPWRARLHSAGYLLIAVSAAAVALHWAMNRILDNIAPGVETQFVDAFAVVTALAVTVLMLGVAWRLGSGGDS